MVEQNEFLEFKILVTKGYWEQICQYISFNMITSNAFINEVIIEKKNRAFCREEMPITYSPNENISIILKNKVISKPLAYFFQFIVDLLEIRFEEPELEIIIQGEKLSDN